MELSGRLKVNNQHIDFLKSQAQLGSFFCLILTPEACSYYMLNNPKYLKSSIASENQKDSKFGKCFS